MEFLGVKIGNDRIKLPPHIDNEILETPKKGDVKILQ